MACLITRLVLNVYGDWTSTTDDSIFVDTNIIIIWPNNITNGENNIIITPKIILVVINDKILANIMKKYIYYILFKSVNI